MKRKKAAKNRISKEAWLYSDGQIRIKLIKVLKKVWRAEGFPENPRREVERFDLTIS